MFYCYLNLESTKTSINWDIIYLRFYCYLNLESTKTNMVLIPRLAVLLLLKS